MNQQPTGYLSWGFFAAKVSLLVLFIYGTTLFLFVIGFKTFILRIKKLIAQKIFK